MKELISEQVSGDILKFLSQHKDSRRGLRLLAKRTNIHSKTLKRLIGKEHTPSYQTLYKLYSHLIGTTDLNRLLNELPNCVREKLNKNDPQLKSVPSYQFNMKLEEELLADTCYSELYVLADTAPFEERFVKRRFGAYGLEILDKMRRKRIIVQQEDGRFTLGPHRSTFSAKAIKAIGLRLVEKYAKPEKTDENFANYMNLFFESVSEETYRKWVEIDEKALKDKLRLLDSPDGRGARPVFIFNILDTLEET